jgi:SAM-dependent methyltransferase
MTLSFRDYLDIKAALDERSLNASVRSAFLHALKNREGLACLDLGVGTGASLWRLLNAGLAADLTITAVDREPELLEIAFRRAVILLGARDYPLTLPSDACIRAQRGGRQIAIDFVTADLKDFMRTEESGLYDAVVAHHVMDLLPPSAMAERIGAWLRPRGVFYATLNYDGGTSLFPAYRDEALEGRILAAYDASMENRRVWGLASGGARSGQRLYAALLESGFEPLAYGSSDWNLTPCRRVYRDRDDICLVKLLKMIHDEAANSGEFEDRALRSWHQNRELDIACRRLGLIVHQIDLLAQRR